MNPHPVFPFSFATATAEHAPLGPAQHPEAQSASERHCPVMNCCPFPFPTFWEPAAPWLTPDEPPLTGGAACGGVEGAASSTAGRPGDPAAGLAPPPNPQPDFPFSSATALAAHAPLGPAQHPEAQSASERHCPVMNCSPLPAPTFDDPGAPDDPDFPLSGAASMDGFARPGAGAGAAPMPSPKPHPCLPAWNWAPTPEQMPAPLRIAQQAEAQSLLLRQAPPMN